MKCPFTAVHPREARKFCRGPRPSLSEARSPSQAAEDEGQDQRVQPWGHPGHAAAAQEVDRPKMTLDSAIGSGVSLKGWGGGLERWRGQEERRGLQDWGRGGGCRAGASTSREAAWAHSAFPGGTLAGFGRGQWQRPHCWGRGSATRTVPQPGSAGNHPATVVCQKGRVGEVGHCPPRAPGAGHSAHPRANRRPV